MVPGIQAAQMCRKEEEIPKDLFPRMSSTGTINPMRGPATYQGQGAVSDSNIYNMLSAQILLLSINRKHPKVKFVNLILGQ
jgi:hypothetical protein